MLLCCVATLCCSEEAGVSVFALLLLHICLDISENFWNRWKFVIGKKFYYSFIWALNNEKSLSKGRLVRWFTAISEWSHSCDLDPYSTFIPGGTSASGICHPSHPCEALQFCNQGGSWRQRQCASCGEWWAVGRDSPASEHCDGSVCPWEAPGDHQYPGHAAKGSPTNLLWKQNQYATFWWGQGWSTICLGMNQVDLHHN